MPIFDHNRHEVIRAIDGFEEALHQLKSSLLNEDNQSFIGQLQRGCAPRRSLDD